MARNRNAYQKQYYEEHKERCQQLGRENYEKHKEKRKIQARQYYKEHQDKLNKKRRLYYWEHRDEELAKSRKYYQNWKPEHRQNCLDANKRYAEKLKIEVLEHYGNGEFACIACGESRFPCLSLDHIFGDGAKQRQLGEKEGGKLYHQLKQQGYPEGYQTLCMNCQWVKKFENKEFSKGKNQYPNKIFV